MGNVSVTVTEWCNEGNSIKTYGTLTFSSSYALGGDSFTVRQFGLGTLRTLSLQPAQGFFFEPDVTNLKVKAFTNRPKGASFGQSLPLFATTVARNTYLPLSATSAASVGVPPRIAQLVTTGGIGVSALFSTAAAYASSTVPVSVATGTGALTPVYAHSSGVLLTTQTTQVSASLLVLQDGGVIPVQVDTSAYYALQVSTGTLSITGTYAYTTANVNLTISNALSLSALNVSGSSTSSQLPEVPSSTDLSAYTVRWEATGF